MLAYIGGTNPIVQFLTALLVFVFVLILTYFTVRWVGAFQKVQGVNKNFEVIETCKVTNNKYLQIVRVGTRLFLIGIGKDEIEYLAELSESDIDMTPGASVQDNFQLLFNKAKDHLKKRSDGNE